MMGYKTKNWTKHGVNVILVHLQFLHQNIIDTYGLDAKFHNEYIYPYGDLNYTYYDGTWAPKMIAKVWPER